jgi:hypothetical protein
MGTPVWSHDGIICTGESYKSVVKGWSRRRHRSAPCSTERGPQIIDILIRRSGPARQSTADALSQPLSCCARGPRVV